MNIIDTIELFVKGFQDGIKEFGLNISTIVNTVLLAIVYIMGAGITSLVAKTIGKHFMDVNLRKSRKAKTYWKDLNLKKQPLEEYYRQF